MYKSNASLNVTDQVILFPVEGILNWAVIFELYSS